MPELVLNDYQTALRAAHEHVQLLEHAYSDLAVDATDRLAELADFRRALLEELKRQNLLPTQPEPERESFMRVLCRIRDALSQQQESLILEEEARLEELGRQIEENGKSLSPGIRKGIEKTRRAIRRQT